MKQIFIFILAALLLASPIAIAGNIGTVSALQDKKVKKEKKTVTVTYDPAKTDEATLQKAIEKLGYTAEKVKPDDKR